MLRGGNKTLNIFSTDERFSCLSSVPQQRKSTAGEIKVINPKIFACFHILLLLLIIIIITHHNFTCLLRRKARICVQRRIYVKDELKKGAKPHCFMAVEANVRVSECINGEIYYFFMIYMLTLYTPYETLGKFY